MWLRNSSFFAAMALIAARASVSPCPLDNSSTLVPLMLSGMTLSIRASSESWPVNASMASISPSRGPIWRAMNSLSVPSGICAVVMSAASGQAFSARKRS
ncbi:hypothetical protein D3C86_1417560 [compost metagenome]